MDATIRGLASGKIRAVLRGQRDDDRRDGTSQALLLVNAAGAMAAAVFAAAGIVRAVHARTDDHPRSPSLFWAASSAVRTWAVTGPLLAAITARRPPAPHLLVAAGLVQLGDSAIGLWQRNLSMTVAPAAMGLIHLGTAYDVACNRGRGMPPQRLDA